MGLIYANCNSCQLNINWHKQHLLQAGKNSHFCGLHSIFELSDLLDLCILFCWGKQVVCGLQQNTSIYQHPNGVLLYRKVHISVHAVREPLAVGRMPGSDYTISAR